MGKKDEFSDSEDDFEMDEIAASEDAISPETLELISTLKKSLEENSNQYEQHTQLISLLKASEKLQELREARESMSKSFPLSEAIKIWESYLEYAIQEYTESMDLPENEVVVNGEYLNSLFQKAKKFTGYHTSQSHVVWNVWIDFELGKLASQEVPSAEDVDRVKAIYLERITIPHSELENTFSGFSSFISKYCGQDYEESMIQSNKIVNTTRELLENLVPFEEHLVTANNSLEAFTGYLDYELSHHKDQFAQIRTLFERAIAVHCLVPSLWNDYLGFLMSSETYLKPEDEVNGILAKALDYLAFVPNSQELSKILLASCSYKFRRSADQGEDGRKELRAAFEHALAVVEAAGGDPYCKLERLWIELESTVLGDHEQARKLWKSIESKQMSMSDFWIARAEMEKKLDNVKGARQIFVRACSTAETLDWPEKIFDSWLLFERECGTLPTYKDALIRTRAALKNVEAVRTQAYASQVASDAIQQAEITTAATADNVPKAGSKKRKLSVQDENNVSKIPKTKDDQKQTKAKPLNISAGHHDDTCFVTNFPPDMTEKKLRDLFKEASRIAGTGERKRHFAYVQFSSNEEAHAALALHGRDVGDRRGLSVQISDTTKRKPRGTGDPPLPLVSRHEIRITGLSNDVKKEDLQKLVKLIAEPIEVYIMRGPAAKGEPWANIKFKSESDANAVLSLNGTMFQSKELTVTRRVFSKSGLSQDNPEVQLTRRERRKQIQAKALAEQESKGQAEGERVAVSTSQTDLSTLDQRGDEETNDKEDTNISAPPPSSSDAKKPPASSLLMQPRSLQPRNLQRGSMKARQFQPKRAFKPASTSTVVTSATTTQAGEDGAQGSSDGPQNDGGAAPKSNADFRTLMLSGTLKKNA
ncbi:Splicing factor [Mortierella sp. AD011]|nr:Splicing factor [Mortierella sp. AD011]